MRDDFKEYTKETLAKRVGMQCSNPNCRKRTSGPRNDPAKALNIGVAAHITAASADGPRHDAALSKAERCSIKNGIWLCQNCAKLVDNDETRFTVEVLRQWKEDAENAARRGIETSERTRSLSQTSAARKKVNQAQEFARSGKTAEAIKEMTEALTLAREEKDEEEEVEILLGIALLSSDRHNRGDRQYYFQEAEKKVDKLKSPSAKVIFFRAKAAVLTERRDISGTEEAYKTALKICLTEREDEKGNLATQGCIVRASFVHFLCHQERHEEARQLLKECEDCARNHASVEEAELLQAALEAGIHFSLDTKDEDGAVDRIGKLESAATTMKLANRIGGDLINVANQASHRKMNRAALCAAEAAIRLGHRCDDGRSPGFLVGAFYTEALVLLNAGNDEKALERAEAVLSLCSRPEDAIIKQAAHQLIAEVRRTAGDSQAAVDLARQALAMATGRPEEVAFTKSALARSLNDNGQTEEALKEAREAWLLLERAGIPPRAAVDHLSQITNYGSQLGETSDVSIALAKIAALPDEDEELKMEKVRASARANANAQIRERLLEIGSRAKSDDEPKLETSRSLQEANAVVMRPLVRFWDEAPECIGGAYDFWGRGNFARLLHNARRFPNSFNVTVEVRSLDDVKRAVRLWGLYADFMLLLWKGKSQNGLVIIPFPEDYKEPGGWGYMICTGDVLRKGGSAKRWYPAMAHISSIPEEVAVFLATEARPFVETGRLVVVPAPAAGCINPGHGPFEQLLAEAANAVPSMRWKGFPGVPIGLVPHAPNAPLKLLVELAEAESDRLRKLRLLLIQRTRQLKPDETIQAETKMLALEIDDSLRDLTDKTDAFARKKGLERAAEPLGGATARFRSNGEPLSGQTSESPFAPLFILQNLGYGWRVESGAIAKPPERFEPQAGDVVGTWLAPPRPGWGIPRAQV